MRVQQFRHGTPPNTLTSSDRVMVAGVRAKVRRVITGGVDMGESAADLSRELALCQNCVDFRRQLCEYVSFVSLSVPWRWCPEYVPRKSRRDQLRVGKRPERRVRSRSRSKNFMCRMAGRGRRSRALSLRR